MDTSINDLEIACLVRIFSFLTAKDCGRAACVHPLWKDVLADEVLWKPHLASDFAARSPVNPNGTAADSSRWGPTTVAGLINRTAASQSSHHLPFSPYSN
jgi:hypothetical protein